MQKELVLVFNCGSSSIKFALINPVTGENKFDGLVECIATEDARIRWNDGETHKKSLENINYKDALSFILSLISENKALYDNVCAVGHRVVHGGEQKSISKCSVGFSSVIICYQKLRNKIYNRS